MTAALLGALVLIFVVIRTWMTGARWYDALAAIALGYLIATAGDGFLNDALGTGVDWVGNVFDFIAKLFR